MYGIEMQAQVVERQQTLRRWFTRALLRGRWHTLWSRVWGKPGGLLDLTTLLAKRNIHTARTTSCQTVPISRIRGSEGRCHDFDSTFHPRQTHTRDRWLHIAHARLDGIELAPVELIRVGEDYFVRDGHHRISVALTFGQREIDAVVTVWDRDEPVVGAVEKQRLALALNQYTRQRGGAQVCSDTTLFDSRIHKYSRSPTRSPQSYKHRAPSA